MKGIRRFEKKGKLSPRFIGPYRITERVGKVAYRLDLSNELGNVHNVFHVSQLRKFLSDPTKIIEPDEVEIDTSLEYEEYPVAILDTKEKKLRNKVIPMVKVLWSRHGNEDATWETEEKMRECYPGLNLYPVQ